MTVRRFTGPRIRLKLLGDLADNWHTSVKSGDYGIFVIHDYKFKAGAATRRKRRSPTPWIAATVVVAVVAAVRFLPGDGWMTAEANDQPAGRSLALPLPTAAEDQAEPAATMPEVASADTRPAPAKPNQEEARPEAPAAEHPAEPPSLIALAHPATDAASPRTADVPVPDAPAAAEKDAPVSNGSPVAEAEPPAEPAWIEHRIQQGDNLAAIFKDHGIPPAVLHGIVNSSDEARSLASIRPGQLLRLRLSADKHLTALELERSRVETLRIEIDDDTYQTERLNKEVDVRLASAAGMIESSLFIDGQKAGLSDRTIMELANIFGWDIDFALEIRAGDEFRVVYEQHFLDGEKLRDGPILAAEFLNRGESFRAVRYENLDGDVAYYDDEGRSKRRAFLRTPIKFGRISSGFNPKRWHPVLKKWRSHKGVDYAAPTGTPILASGDGRVVFRGTKGGYGRTVILQHAGKYTTLYAHMSKYSRRVTNGSRVKQGQVIGYVGRSGLATGPHLHYEFRVQGVHKDPLRVKLPKSLALPDSEMTAFKTATAPLLARLDGIAQDTLIASAGQTAAPEQP